MSEPDDPGRTVVRPNPGGRIARGWSAPGGPAGPGAPPGPLPDPLHGLDAGPADESVRAVLARGTGAPNRLLELATPLLTVAARIRATTHVADPVRLRESLSADVRRFEADAAAAGLPRERIIGARYLLCTFVDEAAAATPWGAGGGWAGDALLVRFHNETWGGEKAFQLLSQIAQQPAENRDLLELFFVCLSLGFVGRYHLIADGRAQLDSIRERLHAMIRQHTPPGDGALSEPARAVTGPRRGFVGATPVWVTVAVSLVLAMGLYAAYAYLLGGRSDPVFAAIQALRLPAVPAVAAPAPPAAARLAPLLAAEVQRGTLAVRDEATRSVVLLRGDGLFAPGSAEVSQPLVPVLQRVGAALRERGGRVLVVGHTDGQPIRTVRFPSNWHLSQERARAVAAVLAPAVGADRLQAEGRGETEPVASDDTPDGRARNRRVEIVLFGR